MWRYHPVLPYNSFLFVLFSFRRSLRPLPSQRPPLHLKHLFCIGSPKPPNPQEEKRLTIYWWFKPTVFWAPLKKILIKCDGWCLFLMCNNSSIIALVLVRMIFMFYMDGILPQDLCLFWYYILLFGYNVRSKIKCNVAVSNRSWDWIIFLSNHTVFFHVGKLHS